ncbi:MAG: flagellar biosynthesis protein FliQ [Lachnospiraceae bacterium]|nr:flagellar biosynthesis protein FliQ [Lachnospiraceae bacterium]
MITVDDVISIAREALYTIIITGAPCLLVSLIIGLLVSVFQTVTSIQEQTLTFVPKILGIFLAIMILGHWMLDMMVNFMTNLWSNMSMYVG